MWRATLIVALGAASPPAAPADPPCSGATYRALDFWVGQWSVSWKRDDGASGHGRNVVTRERLNGCALHEHYVDETTDFSGTSQTAYNRFTRQWVLAWADNQGTPYIARSDGAPRADGTIVFDLDGGGPRELRIVFEAIEADSLVWRFQARPRGTESWRDVTVSSYRRAESP